MYFLTWYNFIMVLLDSLVLGLRNWKNYKGRASRSEYWWFTLANFIGVMVWLAIAALFGSWVLPVAFAWILIFGLAHCTLIIRRLHDVGRRGWFVWLLLVPTIGQVLLLWFLVHKGQNWVNKYGPPRPEMRELVVR